MNAASNINQRVTAEQTRLLYAQAPTALVAAAVVWVATMVALWPRLPTGQLLAWGLAVVSINLFLAVLTWLFRRDQAGEDDLPRWRQLYNVESLTHGVAWGMLGIIALVNESHFVNVFVVSILAWMSVGAVSTLGSQLNVFANFVIPSLAPATLVLFLSEVDFYITLGGLLLTFVVIVLATAYNHNRTLVKSLKLRFQNEDLVSDLLAANDRNEKTAAELREEIAKLNRMEVQLQAATREARSANVAKSQFLANMSHELRTPLNAIIGYGELLYYEADKLANPSFKQGLKMMLSSGEHLLEMVSTVLDFSKIEAGKTELEIVDFDIAVLVHQVVTEIRPLCVKNNNVLTMECPAEIGQMRGDMTKVKQILLNVMSNAIKFTRDGRVTIGVARVADEGDRTIRFTVADTGIGIDTQTLQTLFAPFVQADTSTTRKYGGTGLGLSICKQLCELMGGDIRVESEPGRGSIFTVSVPAALELSRPGRESV